MLEAALIAFTTFFATIGPLDVAAMYAVLTTSHTAKERLRLAFRSTMIAGAILLFFALLGGAVLEKMGITLSALRAAGGILLLLIAIDLVFARDSGGTTTTDEETAEASTRPDISVFPLATPLIAGPGAIGAVILLAADTNYDPIRLAIVVGALVAVLLLTLIGMLLAGQIQRLLGVTGLHVISRIAGVLLAALAVQFIFDGVKQSGIFG